MMYPTRSGTTVRSTTCAVVVAGQYSRCVWMCGYDTTWTSREYVVSWTCASAVISNAPGVRPAGAVTTNEVAVLSPTDLSANGASAGRDVHPCGSRSRNVPFTGCDEKLLTR